MAIQDSVNGWVWVDLWIWAELEGGSGGDWEGRRGEEDLPSEIDERG